MILKNRIGLKKYSHIKCIIYILFIFQSITLTIQAQTVTGFGLGASDGFFYRGFVSAVYVDHVNNHIWAGGTYMYMDTIPCYGISRWDGSKWQNLGTGLIDSTGYSGVRVSDIKRFQNEIYVTGNFSTIGGLTTKTGLAKWDGNQWQVIPGTLLSTGYQAKAGPFKMVEYNNELILVGKIDSLDSNPAKVVSWNGSVWKSIGKNFQGNPCDFNAINAVDVFNNELYVAGNMNCNTPDEEYVYKLVDTTWVQVGTGFNGDCWLNTFANYQNKLYVGGYFSTQGGNVDNSLVYLENGNFMPTNGGTLPANLLDLQEHKGELYAAGQINFAGFQPVDRIAKWNGNQWLNTGVSVYDTLTIGKKGTITAMSEYNGKLLVAGTFTRINNTQANSIALIDFSTSGINLKQDDKNLTLYPNPTSDILTIKVENGNREGSVKLFNQLGQIVYSQINGVFQPVDVSTFAKGVYFAEVRQEDKVMRQKVVVE